MILYYIPPHVTPIAVACEDSAVARWLRLTYGDYITEQAPSAAAIAITVQKDGGEYRVRCDGTTRHTTVPTAVIADLFYEKQHYPATILALHGGAVAKDGKAYLFLAATTSGKTTLTTYLTEQGFSYITDDCILLDEENRVHPFTTPVHLRAGGYEVLRQTGCALSEAVFLDDPAMTRYVFTPKNRATSPLPLERIFFIERTTDRNHCEILKTTEKMTALMKSPIKPYALNAAYLSRLARLTAYPAEKLMYKDLSYVREVIENG